MRRKQNDKRIKILAGIMAAIFAAFGIRLVDFQLISAGKYSTANGTLRVRKVAVKAPRGEILDCYGRPIVTNRSGYDVVFNRAYMSTEGMNETVDYMIKIFTEHKAEWNDILPLTLNNGTAEFGDDEYEIAKLRKLAKVNVYATAENCYNALVEKYMLQSFDSGTARLIMGVRYSMERAEFSVNNPYTFANDIPSELMAVILEHGLESKGVEVSTVPYRDYLEGNVAPQMIGTVGKIDAEDWKELKDKGYSYNDYVGKSGIEKLYEEYLRGTDGEMTYILDNNGNTVSAELTKEPRQGNTVVLTIDKRLQIFAQEAYEKNAAVCDTVFKTDIKGGCVMAVEVNTGRILASANYPSYTMDEYKFGYDTLLNDPRKPLFDRALNGTYAPGSIMKMAMAVAALEEKVTTPTEIIDCVQVYDRYKDYQPKCLHIHGNLNIATAIGQSCNYFFFEMAYRLGIGKMNDYSAAFGLGQPTGIELAEKTGVLAGPAYSESIGQRWTAGATLAAAIGQQNNAFTPIQLMMYCATIANGGTRYKATILKEVRDFYTGEVIVSGEPEVLNEVKMSKTTLDVIRDGMRQVVTEGTAHWYFENSKLNVAGKTGTAETGGEDNTFFCSFAPYEKAEIAVMVVAESGVVSGSTCPVARQVIDQYFFNSNDETEEQKPDELLK